MLLDFRGGIAKDLQIRHGDIQLRLSGGDADGEFLHLLRLAQHGRVVVDSNRLAFHALYIVQCGEKIKHKSTDAAHVRFRWTRRGESGNHVGMMKFPGSAEAFNVPTLAAAVVLRSDSLHDLNCEVARARRKFPSNRHMFAALCEEVGETANALLDKQGRDRIRAEALQVACVAMRLYEEGDADFHEAK